MEKISVIIPTYNREKTILRSVESVLNQTYQNLEVLIVDDGSTDGTVELVAGIQDDRVQCIVLEENGGAANARNVGAEYATGEWIAFQDSDDCWRPEKLAKQLGYAERRPKYDLIYCGCKVYEKDGSWLMAPMQPWPPIMEGEMLKTLLQRNVISMPTVLVKREQFLQSGGFDVSYKALEDWEYMIRFSKEHKIGFVPETLVDVYMQEGGISSNVGNYYESRCKLLAQYRTDMEETGTFDTVMQDILVRANNSGILEPVKNVMMAYLSL